MIEGRTDEIFSKSHLQLKSVKFETPLKYLKYQALSLLFLNNKEIKLKQPWRWHTSCS
jgi:hypothetical protein